MAVRHITREQLTGKTIDVHAHVGVWLKALYCGDFPYAQSLEGLYYRQKSGGVDFNVVFPFCSDLYFDTQKLRNGILTPADDPISPAPFAAENRSLLHEIFEICPELSGRFLPFISIDPLRAVDEQIAELTALDEQYPIYGVKVNPVISQSKAIELLGPGTPLLDFAEERNWPLLFHASTIEGEEYSQATDILQIAESRPGIRFCLAHCLLYNRELLAKAASMSNVWIDTAAMKIQVDLANKLIADDVISGELLIDADYTDFRKVMQTICGMYPEMMLWGTDSPAYSFFCVRKEGKDRTSVFKFKGTYEDEIEALRCLPADLQAKMSNSNILAFLGM